MSQSTPLLGAIVSNTEPSQPPGPEPLIGKHVRLELLEAKHYPDLWESFGTQNDLWTYWLDEPPSSLAEFKTYFENFSTTAGMPDLYGYAVIPLSGPHKGKALGIGWALVENRKNQVGELGAFFGPKLSRTRAGTEAIYLLVDLMFRKNHRRLQWKTNVLNVASRRAAERYGFVFEGTWRQHMINKGRSRDSCWYSIIDSEWPVCKEAFETWLDDGNFDEEGQQKRKIEEIRDSLK
ncbi:acyl-CoA N-acyltransferase [Microthyrium microscopicum]|uniref:Acyl-CoA N-acyltransferase n=1 Tax=Microthyrium microscopicum TaxID=703497 RepID=A0A6A6UEY7_9PEZI|nr:acyl-CoA N-acyltransferase [Microthyrium microscopicum]